MGAAVGILVRGNARTFVAEARAGLRLAFAGRSAWLVLAVVTALYATAYLLLARGLIVDTAARFSRFRAVPSLLVAPDLSWRYVTDFFNPPAILYLGDGVALAPTVPALMAALALGPLVGANLAVALATLKHQSAHCARSSAFGLLSAAPSFLASFTCCAPTVLFVLGANFAVAVVAAVPYVVPLALALLSGSLLWSGRRLSRTAAATCG